jgi:hypothetical protein
MNTEEHDKVPFAVPFAAGPHRDGSIRVYVDGKDCGLRISRNAAGTGVIIEAPIPLKAMDMGLDKLKAIKAIWLKWKADDVTAWIAMSDIEAIIEEL